MKFTTSGGGTSTLSKTATEMHALTGTDGQIIYNTTYKNHFKYSNGRWVPSTMPDQLTGFYLVDDFWPTSTGGQLVWNATGVIAGTGTQATMGVVLVRQATASARSLMFSQTNGLMLGTMDVYTEFLISIPTLATAGEDFSCAIGINDAGAFTSGSLGVDNVCFIYNRGINGANWIIQTTSNSVSTGTSTSTGTAIVAATYYRLGILVRAGVSADFFVNGVNIGQHTTNIPTGRGTNWQVRVDKIAGVGNSDVSVDAFMTWGFFNGARF